MAYPEINIKAHNKADPENSKPSTSDRVKPGSVEFTPSQIKMVIKALGM